MPPELPTVRGALDSTAHEFARGTWLECASVCAGHASAEHGAVRGTRAEKLLAPSLRRVREGKRPRSARAPRTGFRSRLRTVTGATEPSAPRTSCCSGSQPEHLGPPSQVPRAHPAPVGAGRTAEGSSGSQPDGLGSWSPVPRAHPAPVGAKWLRGAGGSTLGARGARKLGAQRR